MKRTLLLLFTAALCMAQTPPYVFDAGQPVCTPSSCSQNTFLFAIPAIGHSATAGNAVCGNFHVEPTAIFGNPAVVPNVIATGCSFPLQLYSKVYDASFVIGYFIRSPPEEIYAQVLQGEAGAIQIGFTTPFWKGYEYSDCYDDKPPRVNYPPPTPCA